MIKILLGLSIVLATSILPAQKLDYKISSMSLKVADLAIDMSPEAIEIRVQNESRFSLFPHLNNVYHVQMDEMYFPISYRRIIHQGELRDSIHTLYSYPTATMHQDSAGQSIRYDVSKSSRDFFSFLYALCQDPSPDESYLLDGDGRSWRAHVGIGQRQRIRTGVGTMYARRHEIQLEPLSEEKAPYVDMLTNNFFDANLVLTIWISDNGIPLKAHLKKNLIGMTWEIIGIR